MEMALERLSLHMDANKLNMLLANIGSDTLSFEDYRMLIENQHIIDSETANALLHRADNYVSLALLLCQSCCCA